MYYKKFRYEFYYHIHDDDHDCYVDCRSRRIGVIVFRKSLKIPKRSSEYANQRRTDNIMTKRKRTKGQLVVRLSAIFQLYRGAQFY